AGQADITKGDVGKISADSWQRIFHRTISTGALEPLSAVNQHRQAVANLAAVFDDRNFDSLWFQERKSFRRSQLMKHKRLTFPQVAGNQTLRSMEYGTATCSGSSRRRAVAIRRSFQGHAQV